MDALVTCCTRIVGSPLSHVTLVSCAPYAGPMATTRWARGALLYIAIGDHTVSLVDPSLTSSEPFFHCRLRQLTNVRLIAPATFVLSFVSAATEHILELASPQSGSLVAMILSHLKIDYICRTWSMPGPRHPCNADTLVLPAAAEEAEVEQGYVSPVEAAATAAAAAAALGDGSSVRRAFRGYSFELDAEWTPLLLDSEERATQGTDSAKRGASSRNVSLRQRFVRSTVSSGRAGGAASMEDDVTDHAILDVFVLSQRSMKSLTRSKCTRVEDFGWEIVTTRTALVDEVSYTTPRRHRKHSNTLDDTSMYEAWQMSMRTGDAKDATSRAAKAVASRLICILVVRRAHIPPLMDTYQDIAFLYHSEPRDDTALQAQAAALMSSPASSPTSGSPSRSRSGAKSPREQAAATSMAASPRRGASPRSGGRGPRDGGGEAVAPMRSLQHLADSLAPLERCAIDTTVVQARVDALLVTSTSYTWLENELRIKPVMLPLAEQFVAILRQLIREVSDRAMHKDEEGAKKEKAKEAAAAAAARKERKRENGDASFATKASLMRDPFTFSKRMVDAIFERDDEGTDGLHTLGKDHLMPVGRMRTAHAGIRKGGTIGEAHREWDEEKEYNRASHTRAYDELVRRSEVLQSTEETICRCWERRVWRFLAWTVSSGAHGIAGGIPSLADSVRAMPRSSPQRVVLQRVIAKMAHIRHRGRVYDERPIRVKLRDVALMADLTFCHEVLAALLRCGYINWLFAEGETTDTLVSYFLVSVTDACVSTDRRCVESRPMQTALTTQLRALSRSPTARRSVSCTADVAKATVKILSKSSDGAVQEELLWTLHTLTLGRKHGHVLMQHLVTRHPALAARVVSLVVSPHEGVVRAAISVLRNFSRGTVSRTAMIESGAIEHLANVLRGGNIAPHHPSLDVVCDVIHTLYNTTRDPIEGRLHCDRLVNALDGKGGGKRGSDMANARFWEMWVRITAHQRAELASVGFRRVGEAKDATSISTVPRMIYILVQLLYPARSEASSPGQFAHFNRTTLTHREDLLSVTVALLTVVAQTKTEYARCIGLCAMPTFAKSAAAGSGPRAKETIANSVMIDLVRRATAVSRRRMVASSQTTTEFLAERTLVLPVLSLIDVLSDSHENCELLFNICGIHRYIDRLTPFDMPHAHDQHGAHQDGSRAAAGARDAEIALQQGWFPDDSDSEDAHAHSRHGMAEVRKIAQPPKLRAEVDGLLARVREKRAHFEQRSIVS